MTNKHFLEIICRSFKEFVHSGTSRSTAKLKPLHGAIAKDISTLLGEGYEVLSQGFGDDREGLIEGRYIDKRVDITITKDGIAIAGVAVKFIMQNYSQNSNNYFENMLGETANIRCNNCPYFQVFIILDRLPYYDKSKNIKKWETFTEHNISKYVALAQDDTRVFFHTPDKTLIYVVHIPDNDRLKTQSQYMTYYKHLSFTLQLSTHDYGQFGNSVIINNYEEFISKIYHTIMAL